MSLKNLSLYNFSIPKFSSFEELDNRFLPVTGDLLSIRYFERIPGRVSFFRINLCYGLCTSCTSSGLTSNFTIRNSFKRNNIELRFLIYSPLLARLVSYDSKRRRYRKSKLYYLRLKKIAKSRFRVDAFLRG